MNSKAGIVSLGCAKNQVDAEMLLYTLKDRGFTIVNDPADADAVIVNTCGFIESAQSEAIDHILSTACLLYTSPSPRDRTRSRMPSSA